MKPESNALNRLSKNKNLTYSPLQLKYRHYGTWRYMDTIGEILKSERNHKKLTLRDVASTVGCSHSYIKRIEDGDAKDNKYVAVVDRLCVLFKMPRNKRLKILEMVAGN